jgi:hypothetical protein
VAFAGRTEDTAMPQKKKVDPVAPKAKSQTAGAKAKKSAKTTSRKTGKMISDAIVKDHVVRVGW